MGDGGEEMAGQPGGVPAAMGQSSRTLQTRDNGTLGIQIRQTYYKPGTWKDHPIVRVYKRAGKVKADLKGQKQNVEQKRLAAMNTDNRLLTREQRAYKSSSTVERLSVSMGSVSLPAGHRRYGENPGTDRESAEKLKGAAAAGNIP